MFVVLMSVRKINENDTLKSEIEKYSKIEQFSVSVNAFKLYEREESLCHLLTCFRFQLLDTFLSLFQRPIVLREMKTFESKLQTIRKKYV